MKLHRFYRRFVLMNAFDAEGGGGGGDIGLPAPAAAPPAEPSVAAPVSTPAVAAPAVPAAPKPTMLDAITKGLDKTAAPAVGAPSVPRDPAGRFVPKVGADGKVLPGQPPAGSPIDPNAAPADDDITAMPEGLGQKAQERFQKLVTANKEVASKLDMASRQIGYVQEVFASNGVQQQQFNQAVSLIGMINKGDYEGAQKVLHQQMQSLAVLSGKPVAPIDALANYPDLREAVDGMQVTEAHALEIARARAQSQQTQQVQQHTQQVQQSQQQEQQAVQLGTTAVDQFCKRMMASDLDYAAIEAHLLPEIPKLLAGVPPKDWARAVEVQYNLIKKVAGSSRSSGAAPSSNPLRPTGHGSLKEAPKTAFEAMWGAPAPR